MLRLTRKQVREVDRIAIEEYGIPGIVLMENAGRNAFWHCCALLKNEGNRVLIVCGGGNNGGDGYVIARHFAENWPIERVTVLSLVPPEQLPHDAAVMARIVQRIEAIQWSTNVSIVQRDDWDLIVDAIYGTGLARAARGNAREAIESMNRHGGRIPILAVDVPSGLDCDTGEPVGVAARASTTVTFVARKIGFDAPGAAEYLGQVRVADIGIPREILDHVRDIA